MFDRWNDNRTEPKPIKEPDPDFLSDDKKEGFKQEKAFRAAAVKLAGIEEEIVGLVKQMPRGWRNKAEEGIITVPREGHKDNFFSVFKDFNQLRTIGGKPTRIAITEEDPSSRSNRNWYEELGSDAKYQLILNGVWSDEDTRSQFEQLVHGDPSIEDLLATYYLFTPQGEYKKAMSVPNQARLINSSRFVKPLTEFYALYKLEMTPGDFEVAGQALVSLKESLEQHPDVKKRVTASNH